MSLKRRIAQRFACWVSGTEPGGRNEKMVREVGVAGIILNATNARSPQQVAALAASLQSAAGPVGLFVGVDQEGGRVTRLRFDGMSRLPPQYHWASHGDEGFVASAAYITNVEIREMGVNMNFAPVLDVYSKPDESVIGDRSFGADPQTVGRFGARYIEAASRAGVVAVAKHFPGHGESDTDSHRLLPVVGTSRAELERRALAPFREVIACGAEAIMTAHVLYTDLDPELPATLSHRIVTGLLRGEMGFDGVVVSDAIEMAALDRDYPIEKILGHAIKAGVDLILVGGRYEPADLVASVEALVERGDLSVQDIDQGVLRILRLKQKRGLLGPQPQRAARAGG
jgi:beta-N-acetylhexosaminidase